MKKHLSPSFILSKTDMLAFLTSQGKESYIQYMTLQPVDVEETLASRLLREKGLPFGTIIEYIDRKVNIENEVKEIVKAVSVFEGHSAQFMEDFKSAENLDKLKGEEKEVIENRREAANGLKELYDIKGQAEKNTATDRGKDRAIFLRAVFQVCVDHYARTFQSVTLKLASKMASHPNMKQAIEEINGTEKELYDIGKDENYKQSLKKYQSLYT